MALSANNERLRFGTTEPPTVVEFAVKAATTIYKGSLVGLDVVTTTGTYGIAPMTAAASAPTSGEVFFVGVAQEQANNSDGLIGVFPWSSRTRSKFTPTTQNLCNVAINGSFIVTLASATAANIGKACWATDDDTVTVTDPTPITSTFVGYVVGVYGTDLAVVTLKQGLGKTVATSG